MRGDGTSRDGKSVCEGELTKDRIHGSTNSNPKCALCNVHDEDHNHFFFNCTYTTDVWTVVASKAQISWPIIPWEQLWAWTIREFGSRSNPRHCMAGLVLASTIYGLWAESWGTLSRLAALANRLMSKGPLLGGGEARALQPDGIFRKPRLFPSFCPYIWAFCCVLF
ncbi:hypothetical protein DKX38_026846 [Salix brachista]|uniref:Reverse transcriptase zinc-binding domain-containing protein n=1 Tax=Salix brachista TaxID=2182728 RepID=A0A5N5JAI7_9ROSI|nr:hypothetical protein DKX38_026846 [Salix brachista]